MGCGCSKPARCGAIHSAVQLRLTQCARCFQACSILRLAGSADKFLTWLTDQTHGGQRPRKGTSKWTFQMLLTFHTPFCSGRSLQHSSQVAAFQEPYVPNSVHTVALTHCLLKAQCHKHSMASCMHLAGWLCANKEQLDKPVLAESNPGLQCLAKRSWTFWHLHVLAIQLPCLTFCAMSRMMLHYMCH